MALSLAGVARATAAGITVTKTGHVPYSVPADEDWVNIAAPSDISTLTNDKIVKDGFGNPDGPANSALAFHVRPGAAVQELINGGAGQITAIEGTAAANNFSTSKATASGLLLNGNVPKVVNNGSIRALAFAHDTEDSATAEAVARGYNYGISGGKVQVNDLANNGVIYARAKAGAFATSTSAQASALAVAVRQVAANSGAAGGKTILSLENGGTIKALATVTASASVGSGEAHATALAVAQSATNAATASAVVSNNGLIFAYAHGSALAARKTAVATYQSAAGITQRVSGNGKGAVASATAVNGGIIRAISIANEQVKGTTTYLEFGRAAARAFGIKQDVTNASSASASVANAGTILVRATANASVAQTYSDVAAARAVGVMQTADAAGGKGSRAANFLDNSGSIKAVSVANADVGLTRPSFTWTFAGATATGVEQRARGGATTLNRAVNSNSITADATANAKAGFISLADAAAGGISQEATGTGSAALLARSWATNSGLIKAAAKAHAQGTYAAEAVVRGYGVRQSAEDARTGRAILGNTGRIDVAGTATANPLNIAPVVSTPGAGRVLIHGSAVASELTGVDQYASGDDIAHSRAVASLTNAGSIFVSGSAKAVGGSTTYIATARARVDRLRGVFQEAEDATNASVSLTNTGSIQVSGHALAIGTHAYASDPAVGVTQSAYGLNAGSTASALVNNSGIIRAVGAAIASATRSYSGAAEASATAGVIGIRQEVGSAVNGADNLVNSGIVAAVAHATAHSVGHAIAKATGTGVDQVFHTALSGSAKASLRNNAGALISAKAFAKAVGADGDAVTATAAANAVRIHNSGSALPIPITLDVVNRGTIRALASAVASGASADTRSAKAFARGIMVSAGSGTLAGSVVNAGSIMVSAFAKGTSASANAVGILDPSAGNNGHITNIGSIRAYAQGSEAHATDIKVAASGAGPASDRTIITNDGSLWAGISTDDGHTVKWGNAIDVSGAPNPVIVQLLDTAPSHIFGNILIGSTDSIVVSGGETIFDGLINPGGPGMGTLDIAATGKLLFSHDPVNGAAGAWVSDFVTAPGGTFAIALTGDATNDPITATKLHYPHVFTTNATLAGTLFVGYDPGIYTSEKIYKDVIDASGKLSGRFGTVADNSALINTTVKYVGNTMEVIADPVAFDQVAGLSGGQQSIGKALDALLGTGKLGTIFPQLFALNNADYANALSALDGAAFAQLNQSVLWSTGQLNSTITDRMDCDANWAAGANGQEGRRCFVPGKTNVWARINGTWNNETGNNGAPGYNESQMGVFGGVDHALANDWFVGLAGGYFTSDMGFDLGGMGSSSINYSGFQVAGYGGYDDGRFYARGIGSYGDYTGSSSRTFSAGTLSPIDPSGSFNASVESFYGETGRRYTVAPQTVVTPFAGISIAHSDVGGFTETSPTPDPTALIVGASHGDSLAGVLGARVEGHWGAWQPELSLAWQHEFLGPTESVTNAFAVAPGTPFTVASSDPGRDWALVSIGTTYSFTPASQLDLKYEGRFASGYSSSSVVARWDTHF